MWPEQGGPAIGLSLNDKANVVHIAIVVSINIQICRYLRTHGIHGSHQHLLFALGPLLRGISIGVVSRKRLEVAARMDISVRNHRVAIGRRIEEGIHGQLIV